jgi:hypothetical protein
MHTAICAFDDRPRAEQARDKLVRSGFDRDDVHIEHKHASSEGHEQTGTDRWDGMEREVAVDRGVLSSFGAFFASLLGRDHPSGHHDTYSRHVDRGGYVVVVDTHDQAEAERARTLLLDLQARDLNVLHRAAQRPLRDIVAMRAGSGTAGMVERSTQPYEGHANVETALQRERATASGVVSPTTGPDLRAPEVDRAPGLRYSDLDKPLG